MNINILVFKGLLNIFSFENLFLFFSFILFILANLYIKEHTTIKDSITIVPKNNKFNSSLVSGAVL